MTAEAVLEELIDQDFRTPMEPPASPRFLLDFARSLINPSGDFANMPYDPTLHPGQIIFLLLVGISMWRGKITELKKPEGVGDMLWRAVIALGRYTRFVLVGDTQSGKSWTMQIALFFMLCELKADVLMGLQDMRAAGDAWTLKIAPAMAKGGLRQFLPISGSGSGGGTDVDTIHINGGGALLFNGAGGHRKHGAIDGRSVPYVINDEFDTLPMEVVNKNEARADAYFRSARRFRASTVKDDDSSNILSSHRQGIQLRIEYECPSCHEYTPLENEQLSVGDATNDRTTAETARIACARCGDLLNETQRQRMLRGNFVPVAAGQTVARDGTIIGQPPESSICSLRWTCFDNPFKSIGHIDRETNVPLGVTIKRRLAENEAKNGRTKDLDDFYHDDLVRVAPVQFREEDIDAKALADRSAASGYARVQVPMRAVFLVTTVDQQKRLLLWKTKAYDNEGRRWSIDWGLEEICAPRVEPTPEQRKDAYSRLDARFAKGWKRQDSADVLRPVLIGMDVADWPDIAEQWMRGRRQWIAVHGAGAEMVKKMKRGAGKVIGEMPGWFKVIEYTGNRTWKMIWPESDAVKKEVSRSFAREIEMPGASMLPLGLGTQDDLIKHLTAERWVYSKDLKRYAWIKVGTYNDYWDCNYYADTIAEYWKSEHPNYRPVTGAPRHQRHASDEPTNLAWDDSLGRFT